MKYRYISTNVYGNLHDAVDWINNNHPEWDVIAFHVVVPGARQTIVVHREIATDASPS